MWRIIVLITIVAIFFGMTQAANLSVPEDYATIQGNDTADLSANTSGMLTIPMTTGAVSGRVTGVFYGNSVAGVYVQADSIGLIDTTDSIGRYLLAGIEEGPHDITFSKPGYDTVVVRNFNIIASDTVTLNVTMVPNTEGYVLIYGNRNQSLLPAVIGARLDIPAWGATPAGNFADSVTFIHNPLSSDNTIISGQLGGYFPDTLVGRWDDASFWLPEADTCDGWTVHPMVGFAWITNPPDRQNWLCTDGDTVPLGTYTLQVANDSSLAGDTLSAFKAGYSHINGGLMWGMTDGVTAVFPLDTYPDLYFLLPSQVGYIAGVVEDTMSNPLADVLVHISGSYKSDTTDASGAFILGWLVPGIYDLTFKEHWSNDTTLAGITVTAGETTRVVFELAAMVPYGGIEGRVTDNSSFPVTGAVVTIDSLGMADTTDENGAFALDSLPVQSVDISFSHPRHADTVLSNIAVVAYDTLTQDMVMTSLPPTAIHIPDDYASIQRGIEISIVGDTILVSPGVYAENINYLGKDIIIKSSAGPENTFLEPLGANPIIRLCNHEGLGAILEGFTVRNSVNIPAIIVDSASVTMRGNTFADNNTNDAAAVISGAGGGTIRLIDNDFTGNNAAFDGGAVYADGAALWASGNRFINNTSGGRGGAIVQRNASNFIIDHNLFHSNQCNFWGGAALIENCDSGSFYNNTVAFNTTENSLHAGGLTISSSNFINVYNNIIALNTGVGLESVSEPEQNIIYNDVWGNTTDYSGITPGVGSISANPLFEGGVPFSFYLVAGSPCIDAGDPSSPLDPDTTRADMGAFFCSARLYGFLAGTVANSSDQPLADVYVNIVNTGFSDTTDTNGYFILGSFRSNESYDIFFSHHDYIETTLTDVTPVPEDTTFLDVILTPAPPRGAIGGTVTNMSEQPIAGAAVSIVSGEGSDTTDVSGNYLIGDLRPGTYDLSFNHELYIDTLVSGVVVTSGGTTTTNVHLREVIQDFMIFYGGPDQDPIPVFIGTTIDIPVWGATPAGNYQDSITFMNNPLASDDAVISSRLGGTFPDTFVGRWDDASFRPPNPNSPQPGWTNQSMLGFAWIIGPPSPENFFWTNGEIAPICTFQMQVANDPSSAGDTLSPFMEGLDPISGPLLWVDQNGVQSYIPQASYPRLLLLSYEYVGYIAGTVVDSSEYPSEGISIEVVGQPRADTTDTFGNYFLGWLLPGNYTLHLFKEGVVDKFREGIIVASGDTTIVDIDLSEGNCAYVVGDANGNDAFNGLDVTYSVAYFKGGPPPPYECECTPGNTWYVSGDVNQSCSFNGLDVTYMVAYFKGGPLPHPCPDCPPAER